MARKAKMSKETPNTPGGILARLRNQILVELNIDPSMLVAVTDQWAIKQNGNISNQNSQYTRTNALAAFSKGEMTWGKFCLFLEVLNLDEAEININYVKKNFGSKSATEKVLYSEEETLIIRKEDEVKPKVIKSAPLSVDPSTVKGDSNVK